MTTRDAGTDPMGSIGPGTDGWLALGCSASDWRY
jgi:hypothetical protein